MHIDNQDRSFIPIVGAGAAWMLGGGARAALVLPALNYRLCLLKTIIALLPIVGAGVVWMLGGGACAALVHYRYTMNQHFSSQGMTSIVGATLAVALITLPLLPLRCVEREGMKQASSRKTSEGGGEFLEKRCRAPARLALTGEGSELNILFQNET